MRDGVELSSDVWFPPAGIDGGPYPVLLFRTPYGNQGAAPLRYAKYLSDRGFVVALQDVRGRHDSDGDFYPFNYEGPDGYDSVEWFAQQEWCSGRVGMFGGSYVGWVQWAAARERPPHLTTLVSTAAAGRWCEELPYNNGMTYLPLFGWLNTVAGRIWNDSGSIDWQTVYRTLPLRDLPKAIGRDMPVVHDWLDHPFLDDYWTSVRLTADDFASIDLPVLHITGWYDGDQPGTLFFYDGMRAHSPARDQQHVLIGPWDHGGTRVPARTTGGVDFGEDAVFDVLDLHARWFDRFLNETDNGVDRDDRVRYFAMGTNAWRTAEAWPPAGTATSYFLGPEGSLATAAGDGSDSYVYDPMDPVVTSTDWCFYPTPPQQYAAAPIDRRFAERRADVLVYTSEAVTADFDIAGKPMVHLEASSDCADTDWIVWLTDVAPSGASTLLTQGRMRARFRESLSSEVLMTPGERYAFTFECDATAHTFLPGHRIRVDVTSSDFPTYARNLNTGGVSADEVDPRVATNTVFHSSRVELPVVPA
ncbi:MAG TPA: CocE/NonD family hydrolase [Acidimicrobiales bacterium]|nr:CocE/NonD family hydrolase [Acidimicrobiales bacterium]